jgi:4-hydroxybenzoate polyprenyltransferase
VEFDRAHHLHSLPAMLGERRALGIARGLHACTIVFLAAVGAATFTGTHGGSVYALGVVVAAGLLVYEHSLVRSDDLSRLDAAFFTMNGIISIVFFLCVLLERLLHPVAALYAAAPIR